MSSKCGLTPQYESLQRFAKPTRPRTPGPWFQCNQFGGKSREQTRMFKGFAPLDMELRFQCLENRREWAQPTRTICLIDLGKYDPEEEGTLVGTSPSSQSTGRNRDGPLYLFSKVDNPELLKSWKRPWAKNPHRFFSFKIFGLTQ